MITEQVAGYLSQVQEVAGYVWQRGWIERNGGNISLNLSGLDGLPPSAQSTDLLAGQYPHTACPDLALPQAAAGMCIFVTGTGERLRDLCTRMEEVACILCIDNQAEGYYLLWGGKNKPNFRPTSELISHVHIHCREQAKRSGKRCVLHCHPSDLLVASYHPQLSGKQEQFDTTLWSMLPEVRVFVPQGVRLVPYAIPGSQTLADLTLKALEYSDIVLWQKHGALAIGENCIEAFDLIDVANKGAMLFLRCLSAGFTPQGLSTEELLELEALLP